MANDAEAVVDIQPVFVKKLLVKGVLANQNEVVITFSARSSSDVEIKEISARKTGQGAMDSFMRAITDPVAGEDGGRRRRVNFRILKWAESNSLFQDTNGTAIPVVVNP